MTTTSKEMGFGRLAQLSANIKLDLWRAKQREAQRELLLAQHAADVAAASLRCAEREAARLQAEQEADKLIDGS